MATEAQVSTAIVRGLRLCGHFAFKASDKYTAGVSDILGTYSNLPLLVQTETVSFHPQGRYYAGKSIAVETKIVKAWPKRGTSKVLQHEFSRKQHEFLEAVDDRAGLAYVALAGPGKRPGVEVLLIPFVTWEHGAQAFDGKNVTLEWLQAQSRLQMRGNLSKGFLASAGPLEASFV